MTGQGSEPLRIGFLGAGPVTQAIHLPVLATQSDRWRIGAVMDPDPAVAAIVAARCDARAASRIEDVLDDPAIDVVAVCSPNAFHAEQAIAACRAGKRAVLCEKPLAVSVEEAERIAAAAAETGTIVMVGTMHRFDPACVDALAAWRRSGADATSIRSTIFLPPNGLFVGLATQEAVPSGGPPPAPANPDPEHERRMLRATVLGLLIHDIPLLRAFFPDVGDIVSARRIPPFGYSILMADQSQTAELNAVMPGAWPLQWTFEATGADASFAIRFPPSYISAGSAEAVVRTGGSRAAFGGDENGYEAQWRHLHAVLTEGAAPMAPLAEAIEDLRYAIAIADRAAACLETGR